ncbi:8865_t:CDS:2 [Gigaspora rosea]|nr:8865_t:CDS:2 [Gigaspora rosea]
MNLINNEITDTPAFFTVLSRVYDYYKSGKKKKENRFKKNEFTIVSLKNMKCYNCRRKGHLMSDCRSKNKIKDITKERNFQKRFSKDKSKKNLTKKEMDIRTKEEEHGNPEKIIKNGKNQRKEKTHPSLSEPKKKDTRNQHFAQKTHQANMKRNINHLTKKNTKIRKCSVTTTKLIHILPIAVINTERT